MRNSIDIWPCSLEEWVNNSMTILADGWKPIDPFCTPQEWNKGWIVIVLERPVGANS